MSPVHNILMNKRSEILEISASYGMLNPRIFGSVSRGVMNPNDLDILVKAEPGRSCFDLIDYSEALEKIVGIPVDVVSEGGLSPFLKDEILNSAIEL